MWKPDPSRAGAGTVIHTEIVRRPTILTFLRVELNDIFHDWYIVCLEKIIFLKQIWSDLVSVFWQDSHLELTIVADADVHVRVLDRLWDHLHNHWSDPMVVIGFDIKQGLDCRKSWGLVVYWWNHCVRHSKKCKNYRIDNASKDVVGGVTVSVVLVSVWICDL